MMAAVERATSRFRSIAAAIILVAGSLLTAPLAGGEQIPVDAFLTTMLPEGARWGLSVIDLGSGKEVVGAGNAAGEAMIPGSLVKLVVTGAVLDYVTEGGKLDLGTTLTLSGKVDAGVLRGNTYLTGHGNAALQIADLDRLADGLSKRGISTINGDVVVDATAFDPTGLERSRPGPSQAPAGALGLDLHTVAVLVSPAKAGEPPVVRIEPENDDVKIAVEARTVPVTGAVPIIRKLNDAAITVSGNAALGGAVIRARFPVDDPAVFSGTAFRTLLGKRGVVVTGQVRKGMRPEGEELESVASPDLDRTLAAMNFNSINVVADNLFLALGRATSGSPGSLRSGKKAIDSFLEKMGLPPNAGHVVDGSGLHAENRCKPIMLARYLAKVASRPWFSRFHGSLPRPGRDGTLQDMGFRDDRFRVKSGILENTYGLAGYGVSRNGRKMAFSFIVNHPAAGVLDMKRAGAALLSYLSTEVSL